MTIAMWCSTSSTVRSRLVAEVLDGLGQLVDLAVGEAVRRLVEQQQPGLADERPGELDALERAVRQAGGRVVGESAEIDLGRGRSTPWPRVGAPRCAVPIRSAAVEARSASTGRGPRPSRSRARSCPATAPGSGTCGRCRAGDAVGRRGQDVVAVEGDRARSPGRRCRLTHVERVVLPAPLGPMRAQISPASTVKREVVERHDAAEADRERVDVE